MPELPEVETIARGLAKRVTGDVIESVWLGSKPEPLKCPAKDIAATLEHARIAAVRRMGKHIVFDLERGKRTGKGGDEASTRPARGKDRRPPVNGAQWIVHLGMTGQLLFCFPAAELQRQPHVIVQLAS